MADVTVTARNVSPLPGAICRPFLAGGSGSVGNLVYIASDGDVEVTDADAAGTARAHGMVVSAGTEGATTFASGDAVSVCVFGPVAGFSGATPGVLAYVSNTAGAVGDAAGTTSHIVGRFQSATELFIHPAVA